MELLSADTSAWWGKPIMLWSYCCGDSTFVNDMATRLLAAYFNPPGGIRPLGQKELLKWDSLDQARQKEGVSSGDTKAAALWAFNDAFKQRNALFFWTGDSDRDGQYLESDAAQAIKEMNTRIFTTIRSPLDTFLCETRDCFHKKTELGSWAEAVYANGARSDLCFNRRSSNTPVLVRIHNFEALASYLREKKNSQRDELEGILKRHGLWMNGDANVEDLEGFEFEATPGPLTDAAVEAWAKVLYSVGAPIGKDAIRTAMMQVMHLEGKARMDEPYSWRLWKGDDDDYRKQVEGLVWEFGYRRWPGDSSPLLDWGNVPSTMGSSQHGLPTAGGETLSILEHDEPAIFV